MSAFVECLAAGTVKNLPVEDGRVEWSETLASGGTTTNEVAGDGYFITVTTDEDGYVAVGPAPDSSVNPRHRMKSGIPRSFSVANGDKAHYTAG